MRSEVQQLYPTPGPSRPLPGTYLTHGLHALGTPQRPFTYANFVSSIDGRVAIVEPDRGDAYGLDDLASGHDWRLFQELQAQADCMVTHGSYLRALAAGRFPDILQVGLAADATDLSAWRQAHGLSAQPAIAVISRSLDFDLPDSLAQHQQAVYLLAPENAPAQRVRAWQARGYHVILTGTANEVHGEAVVRTLGGFGHRCIYLMAGPQLLQTMLRDGALSRLYLTLTHQVLGGERFHTITCGPVLHTAGRLKLHALYYDPESPKGTGQWFAAFDVREPGAAVYRAPDGS